MSSGRQIQTILSRISQSEIGNGFILPSPIRHWYSAARPPLRRRSIGSSHGRVLRTKRSIGRNGPSSLCFCSRSRGRHQTRCFCCLGTMASLYIEALQTGVSGERQFSRIFPVHPRSLASVLSPRPSALGVLLRLCRPSGLGFQRKISLRLRPLRARFCLRSLRRKTRLRRLGAGHLASLRAGVSRGQYGLIQTGEKQWHSTKTK